MRKLHTGNLEPYRVTSGDFRTSEADGYNGVFLIPLKGTEPFNVMLFVIASDGTEAVCEGWEHVSVRAIYTNTKGEEKERVPIWAEMCLVKRLFWHESETVVQFHPAESEYVNINENVLHLWRHKSGKIEGLPPKILI